MAIESAQVLPKGVNYATLRTAQVSQASQKFGPNGVLANQGDFYTQDIDLTQLMRFLKPEKKEELQKLVHALNQAGRSELGNKLHLGQLKVEIHPDIKYVCPVFARGITDEWTVGFAIPIIQYALDIRMQQVSSNIPFIQNELQAVAEASTELKSGLETLNQNLALAAQDTFAAKGYKRVESRKNTFLGDIHLVSLYQFYKNSRWTSVFKTSVVLPTGPKDDADDLTDITSQHQTGLGGTVIQEYQFNDYTTMGVNAGYFARLPDQAEKRVPASADDILPDADRKEALHRDLGDSITGGLTARHSFSDYIALGAGWEWGQKQEDKYSGSRDYEYYLLSRNTSQEWQKAMATIEYSTAKGYLQKRDAVPYGIGYEFSEIMSGRNIERAQIHEVSMKMFF
ncbi:MAG: hypothetical protein AB7F59_09740 [Bdellovibrionales bacterium]